MKRSVELGWPFIQGLEGSFDYFKAVWSCCRSSQTILELYSNRFSRLTASCWEKNERLILKLVFRFRNMLHIPTEVLSTESCIEPEQKEIFFSGHKRRSSWNMALDWKRNQSCANLYLRRINWMDFWWELLIFCDENWNTRSLRNPRLRFASLLFFRIVAFDLRRIVAFDLLAFTMHTSERKHCLGNVSRFKFASCPLQKTDGFLLFLNSIYFVDDYEDAVDDGDDVCIEVHIAIWWWWVGWYVERIGVCGR